ncbi:MAG: glycosyltransferase family 4 protein [Anaerolineae bacterium]|nr:glycosyltransferase family 4 protein [Anaerolineae bacterium]
MAAVPRFDIAFVGQKGIPATFGGIEFHVDELARRLVQRGHRVTVYVRSWYTPRDLDTYEGVRLVHTPTLRTKHLDAAIHSLTSSLHSLRQTYDLVHYHAMGPSVFAWLPRLQGRRVVVTVHALDWQRVKWGRSARAFLKMTERTALYLSDCTVVISRALERHFMEKYARAVCYIPNGVTVPTPTDPQLICQSYGLQGDDYVLFLARLVPEKRPEWMIRAFLQLATPLRLVIAGADEVHGAYSRTLAALAGADPRVIFAGQVEGRLKEELLSNAHCFVTPSSMEGLPIALLEAMAHGRCCLASDIPAHQEIIDPGRDGLLFAWDDDRQFARSLHDLLAQSEASRQALGEQARLKVAESYTWDRVTEATEALYARLLAGGAGRA